ncbi:MAG: hypothetical protein U0232_03395 [Thermomicrobiales bacterium]
MWRQQLLWGVWNGLTAWVILITHVFGGWEHYPLYDLARGGNWYDFGFLIGAGSPLLGMAGRRSAVSTTESSRPSRSPAQSGAAVATEV